MSSVFSIFFKVFSYFDFLDESWVCFDCLTTTCKILNNSPQSGNFNLIYKNDKLRSSKHQCERQNEYNFSPQSDTKQNLLLLNSFFSENITKYNKNIYTIVIRNTYHRSRHD